MANVTYTVVKGDTLSEIAVRYGTTVAKLVELNNIEDPDFIVVGQKLIISGTGSTKQSNFSSKAVIKEFGLQSNTDRTIYATWTWDKEDTENYNVIWYYDTGDSVWFIGTDTKTTQKQSTYNAPSNAKRIKFKVKPIAKSKTTVGSSSAQWTAEWSTEKTYDFSNNPPATPAAPTVKIEKYTLTATIENLVVNGDSVQFQVVKNNSSIINTGTASIKTNSVTYSCTVDAGAEYKVRCRIYRGKISGEWSPYSANVSTIPAAPSAITVCRASSKTSVYLEWSESKTATSYNIEYTTKKEYFDGSDGTTTISNIESANYEKIGLEMGSEYFFRVRAVNNQGQSPWSGIKSVVLGKDPVAPTTWSSSTTVVTGEPLNLYWVHNSEDGSSQTYAELELYIDGVKEVHTIQNSTDEDKKDKTSVYSVNTSEYIEGTKIQWRVRTAGITKTYGEWSIQRTVDIYAPPTLELRVTDKNSSVFETLTSFPFYVSGLAGPNTQIPIGYQLSVISNDTYETVDSVGNIKMVSAGEQIFSRYFDTSEHLIVELSANNIDLANNVSYTVKCMVSMNSGLTAESSSNFTVAWEDTFYSPNAEIGIDEDTFSAFIQPYCTDENGHRIADILLSVYRREFNGSFTELASGIDNLSNTYITDPHPALDYARYRVVAITGSTGAVSYYDIPGYPVGGKAAIIQWNEEWSSFDVSNEDALAQPPWSGSMLKLPYNIDVSDNNKPDVALVEYIGREHPVSYYGTQRGTNSTWNVDIPKDDKETLYALRRLQNWMGDAYVREPSGSGYWANVTVSFSQKHCEKTIPVTLNIVRVEGGV